MAPTPRIENLQVPVFMPTKTGASELVMGVATLEKGNLNIQFADNIPGEAMQRMLLRGELLGISFVMLRPPAEPETVVEE